MNNQAEYESLIAGLKFAKGLGARRLDVYSDSKLMVNQLTGSYQTKDEVLKRYFQLAKTLLQHFAQTSLFHIPREMNSLADELAKEENDNALDILFLAFEDPQIFDIDSNPGSWMDDIRHYLLTGELPNDRNKARRLRVKAARYIISQGQLFRRCYSLPLAKCIRKENSKIVLEQIHSGDCGTHAVGRNLSLQVLRQGYYWLNLQKDAKEFSQKCPQCQFYSSILKQLAAQLHPITSSWPFSMWGLNFLRPFSKSRKNLRHVLLATDYFSKWVEAKPMAQPTGTSVRNFIWTQLVCRFGVPLSLICDNGTAFTS
ncbi:hypothetical protein AXF42_Ash019715 [Apostasia shenzhenica]|uniref:Uncharacterized protein n=1 Tax=Apostasia shenzhenica TaxID=1088818 RepID=A0A2H9ZRN0_9ASPA|nr:hypothetical protein AXF42_Ash019715 [Apostasia shenzhenica]